MSATNFLIRNKLIQFQQSGLFTIVSHFMTSRAQAIISVAKIEFEPFSVSHSLVSVNRNGVQQQQRQQRQQKKSEEKQNNYVNCICLSSVATCAVRLYASLVSLLTFGIRSHLNTKKCRQSKLLIARTRQTYFTVFFPLVSLSLPFSHTHSVSSNAPLSRLKCFVIETIFEHIFCVHFECTHMCIHILHSKFIPHACVC